MNPQQRIQRQLEDVLKLPGNDRCADCHASSPRWASVNLGIFLCVTCASVHRKMGTHRSRVKSVTLDEWTRDQVQGMKETGNIKSNAVYNPDERKHCPPANTSSDERDSELAKYIRRKYELRAFAAAAAPELATSNAVTSRSMAKEARKGHPEFASVLQNHRAAPAPPASASDRTFSVPSSPARPRPTRSVTGPAWSALEPPAGAGGVSPNSTGSSPSKLSPASAASLNPVPPRSNSISAVSSTAGRLAVSPSFSSMRAPSPTPVQQKPANLLIDLEGSTSSTRPLQVNSFPTVPAWQPQQQQQLAPQQFAQPTLLGQQAFASPVGMPTTNPFFANYVQQPVQSPVLQTPTGYPMQSPGIYSPGLAFPQFPQQQPQQQMSPVGVPVYAQQQAYPQFGQYGTYPVHM
ncbi:Protein gts1 [Vanrija albida]|uniref:Protein gts1 n=1 Tax=Vanrija albida TaxID=181172 RepID=A0ABR3Q4Z3_9TREE